jgi:hypothetical protein
MTTKEALERLFDAAHVQILRERTQLMRFSADTFPEELCANELDHEALKHVKRMIEEIDQ